MHLLTKLLGPGMGSSKLEVCGSVEWRTGRHVGLPKLSISEHIFEGGGTILLEVSGSFGLIGLLGRSFVLVCIWIEEIFCSLLTT